MPMGLLGKKLGMTHVYDEYGRRFAVTAVQAGPCTVTALREPSREGYAAVQLGFESIKASRLTKPQVGQFKKASTGPFRYVREFRVTELPAEGEGAWKVGQQVTVELFKPYELVDVTGISIGKGFQGGMKRWGWKGGSRTHGSTSHRRPGSIGSTTTPGRVIRGHHLPGHMGSDRVTVQKLRLMGVDPAHNLLLVQGAIPGSRRSLVLISKSKKAPGVIRAPREFAAIIEDEEGLSKTAKAIAKKPTTQAAAK